MDKAQYSTLLEALKDVPDPRQAREQRYAWSLLLTRMGGEWSTDGARDGGSGGTAHG